uniref:DNA damage-binding protein 1 n=1 Tax=Romanomermis culicivorax TaxID=13658 RepID=A0A915J2E8_ROMCU
MTLRYILQCLTHTRAPNYLATKERKAILREVHREYQMEMDKRAEEKKQKDAIALAKAVTPQRATAVSGAVKCHFIGEDHLNLVVVKNTRLEIYTVTPEGLKLIKEVGMYGRIALIKAFKPHGEAKDVLFILTAKYNAAILEWRKDGEIITRAYGNVAENTGRPSEMGMIAIIDPECKLIGLRLVDGLFKVLQWQSDSRELKLTSLRMEQINVLDITFLHGYSKPTIAFIYQSSNNGRHIQTYEVSFQDKELIRGPWKQDNIETEAAFIIPVPKPMCGVIVLGEESITYHFKENGYVAIAPPVIKLSTIAVWEQIDPEGLRYLLGDMAGRLFMLVLERGSTADGVVSVKDMKIELLGETSIPECIVYLDNGVVFIGSRLGDSQLIRLNSEPDERGSFVTILDSYTNLGPIVDMIVVDLERQGQNQLITCSNAFKDGSIRIIRNGVGIQENASIDLPGLKGLWALRYDTTSTSHNCLTIAFVGQTSTLLLNDEEVEESELPGFEYNEQTFHAGNLESANVIVQVVETMVRLIDANGHGLIDCWKLPVTESRITVVAASATNHQVLLSSGRHLYYLTIDDKRIVEKSSSTLQFEVACLDMSLLNAEGLAEVAAVGLWTDISVRIIHLPSMKDISREQLGGEIIPRSILICQFEGLLYLLVALGDGTLLYYRMHQTSGALIDKKKMTLGTQPITLKVFQSRGAINVFGCSDRPTIIYSSNQKLVFSNVNMRLITQICPLNTAIYRECLAMTDGQTLIIGSVDEIQKLHIRTVPLGETVRRIAHQESTKTFGLLTVRYEMVSHNGARLPLRQSASTLAQTTSHSGTTIRQGSSGGPSTASTSATAATASAQPLAEGDQVEVHNILILDQTTFEIIHAHQLGPNEHACSITSCKLGDDPIYYYIVGTAFVYNEEPDSKHGRLLVFEYSNNDQSGPQFLLIHEKEIKGMNLTYEP